MAVSELDPRRALVLRVKGYIANKEYAKARALLNKLDHPKRDEWLAKLDQVEAHQTQMPATRTHQYPRFGLYVFVAMLVTVGGIAMFAGFATRQLSTVFTSISEPGEFNDGVLALTIPSGWKSVPLNQVRACTDDPYMTCRLYLARNTAEPAQMLFATVNIDISSISVRDVAYGIWYSLDEDTPATPLDMGEYAVAGKPAYFINYETSGGTHQTDLVIETGSRPVYISVIAMTREAMDKNWAQIDSILQSLTFP